MPATREQVEQLFREHEGQTVLREIHGDGRRIARQIKLLDPDSACEHFITTAVGQLNIDGRTAVAQNKDGLHTVFMF